MVTNGGNKPKATNGAFLYLTIKGIITAMVQAKKIKLKASRLNIDNNTSNAKINFGVLVLSENFILPLHSNNHKFKT
jgi:hypothetical protein